MLNYGNKAKPLVDQREMKKKYTHLHRLSQFFKYANGLDHLERRRPDRGPMLEQNELATPAGGLRVTYERGLRKLGRPAMDCDIADFLRV